MKRSVAREWIKALESGRYRQTKSILGAYNHVRHRAEFCCLGVLCEVAKKDGLEIEKLRAPDASTYRYDQEDAELPGSVQKWSGLSTPSGGRLNENGFEIDSLATLNDGGSSFKDIAAVIRKEWRTL